MEATQELQKVEVSEPKFIKISAINHKKFGHHSYGDYYDASTGRLRELKDPFTGAKFSFEMARPIITLNMDIERDKAIFMHMKDFPDIVKGPKPVLRIIVEEEQATSNVKKKMRVLKASQLIAELHGTALFDFARLCGIETRGTTEDIIINKLFAKSEGDPDNIMRLYQDPYRQKREVVFKAKDLGLITAVSGIWKYHDVILGTTIEHVLDYFQKNPDIFYTLQRDMGIVYDTPEGPVDTSKVVTKKLGESQSEKMKRMWAEKKAKGINCLKEDGKGIGKSSQEKREEVAVNV